MEWLYSPVNVHGGMDNLLDKIHSFILPFTLVQWAPFWQNYCLRFYVRLILPITFSKRCSSWHCSIEIIFLFFFFLLAILPFLPSILIFSFPFFHPFLHFCYPFLPSSHLPSLLPVTKILAYGGKKNEKLPVCIIKTQKPNHKAKETSFVFITKFHNLGPGFCGLWKHGTDNKVTSRI